MTNKKYVEEAPYHPGYEDAVVNPDDGRPLSVVIRERMIAGKKRFWAGDNISDYVSLTDKHQLIEEATVAFEGVLDALLIDRKYDPNSHGTARRLAKMYYTEIMAGRYDPAPDATAFPNDSENRYEGMLVVRSELRSMCSHHHQPVDGVAYIGIIAANKLQLMDDFWMVAAVIIITMLMVAFPVIITYAMPKESTKILGPVNVFMSKHGAQIANVYFMLMAVYLIYAGVTKLF